MALIINSNSLTSTNDYDKRMGGRQGSIIFQSTKEIILGESLHQYKCKIRVSTTISLLFSPNLGVEYKCIETYCTYCGGVVLQISYRNVKSVH